MPSPEEKPVQPDARCEPDGPVTRAQCEILLTEYKETIETLRNWDRLMIQILTVISSVSAALIAYSQQRMQQVPWTPIVSLVTFWIAIYLWEFFLSAARIESIVSIEKRLGMDGSYQRVQEIKGRKAATFWLLAPLSCAFVIGPLLGYLLSNPHGIWAWLREVWRSILF